MSLPVPNQWPKRCHCGCTYSQAMWTTLRLVGIHSDEYECMEMRDCLCKSTLSVIIEKYREDDDLPLAREAA